MIYFIKRKVLCVGDGKTKENDISGHVGDEYVAQFKITHSINQSGDRRKEEKQRRKRTMPIVLPGNDGVSQVLEDRHSTLLSITLENDS